MEPIDVQEKTHQKNGSTPTRAHGTLNMFFERSVQKAVDNAGGETSFAGMVIRRVVNEGRKWSVKHKQ